MTTHTNPVPPDDGDAVDAPTELLPELLTPAEVGGIFGVEPRTVTRWAKDGKLTSIRTLGGHRRYNRLEVEALLAARQEAADA